VAKKSNPEARPGAARRARVEELKRAQKSAERRKNWTMAGVGVLIAAGLIAIPVVQVIHNNHKKNRQPADIGVSAAAAMCDAEITDPASGGQNHVGGGVHVDYATVPPSSGKHFEIPATVSSRGYYTTKDVPTIEQLVHNLEHGYTVAWYDPKIDGGELSQLKDLAGLLHNKPQYYKFIAAPWDTTRGAFPTGKPLALTHWGGQTSAYRQFCGHVSGAAVQTFMNAHPASDSPEPNTP